MAVWIPSAPNKTPIKTNPNKLKVFILELLWLTQQVTTVDTRKKNWLNKKQDLVKMIPGE